MAFSVLSPFPMSVSSSAFRTFFHWACLAGEGGRLVARGYHRSDMARERHLGMRAAVVTVSDGVHSGERRDDSGDAVSAALEGAGFQVVQRAVVPDEGEQIEQVLRELSHIAELVVTTGGTGLGPRDVTPEATRAVME